MTLRVLLLADTHLGFDLPLSPRIRRRRRGHDFLANYHRALEPAFADEVDLVVHGGDVFNRARAHPTLVAQAFEPLRRLADQGMPVFVVPGNHERSRIPHPRFAAHPGIRVFHEARTFQVTVRGVRVGLYGFPYQRRDVRSHFPTLVAASGWRAGEYDVSLLCVHHCFEGATVGPADFTFRNNRDVIRCRDIPLGTTAVLTGHIHRHQVLTTDLAGRPLHAPVIYPGSVERTSFAEMDEAKGYVVLEIGTDGKSAREGPAMRWDFRRLPARPMVTTAFSAEGLGEAEVEEHLRQALAGAPPDAVLRVRIDGQLARETRAALAAAPLRAMTPAGMNLEVVLVDDPRRRRPTRTSTSRSVQPA